MSLEFKSVLTQHPLAIRNQDNYYVLCSSNGLAMVNASDAPTTSTITTAPTTIPTMFQRRACLEQR